MKYELYHDESKEAGYWHGMLLVPTSTKGELVSKLNEVRKYTKHQHEIGLKNVKKSSGKVYSCAQAWIQIGIGSLRSKVKGIPYHVHMGDKVRGIPQCSIMNSPIGCKFIVFREVDNHQGYEHYPDYGSKIETSFRIGLKGGLHFFGSDESPIEITKLHFDGHQHYQRNLNPERIVGRIKGLRSYCQIVDEIDDRSSDHDKQDSQSHEDCQLLQLTDLLIGSFRTCLHQTRDAHAKLAFPAQVLLKEYQKGHARMKNSRWAGGLSISQCCCNDGSWVYNSIEFFKKDSGQQELKL